MKAHIRPAVVSVVVFTLLLGLAYPALVTVLGIVIPKPSPAELVGRPFDNPAYFFGRPSAVGYNAMASGGANQGPGGYGDRGSLGANRALVEAVQGRIDVLQQLDPANTAPVPVDLVTASSSGLDPDISPAAARYQVPRVARLRGVAEDRILAIVERTITERTLGVLGERRVNVVRLNRELDREVGPPRS